MMASFIRLEGVTRNNRSEMIAKMRDAFTATGGWIVDFHEFSNLTLCVNFEIPLRNIAKLVATLRATGLEIAQADHPDLVGDTSASVTVDEASKSDAVGTLQITFIHSEPDLVIPVPPIPG